MVLYYVGEEWLDYYFNSSSYMVNMQKPYLESLQQYIKKNGITIQEARNLSPIKIPNPTHIPIGTIILIPNCNIIEYD